MTLAQWLSIIIFALWPLIHVMALYISRIPELQRQLLEQSAPRAVHAIEQEKGDLSGDTKKQLAIASIARSFKAARFPPLPPLPKEVVSDAIEDAVFLLPPKE